VFGNHVGDWEHVTLRLTRQQDAQGRQALVPAQIWLDAHGKKAGSLLPWAKIKKTDGDHPIIYAAWGSHGSYPTAGNHKYAKVAVKDLVDRTHAGTAWDTWNKLECFVHETKSGVRGLGPTWKGTCPKWLEKDTGDKSVGNEDPVSGPITRWGNWRMGDSYGGYYRLEIGPTGPANKPYLTTPKLD
jgi:hypothetical protein